VAGAKALYGLEYPTIESPGLCHCKTFVLDKLGPPLRYRIFLSFAEDTIISNNGSFKEPGTCPVLWEGTCIERHLWV
jgi:hypothetical protein